MKALRRVTVCLAAAVTPALIASAAPVAGATPTSWAQASTTTVLAAAAQAKPTVKASVRTARKDQAVTFTGKAAANANVVVQYAVGKSWRALPTKARANASGNYRIAVKHPANGRVVYRVASTRGKVTTYSSGVAIAAPPTARWYWLANYRPGARSYAYRSAALELAGQSHQYAVHTDNSGNTSYATYRLNGTCSQLTTFAGTKGWSESYKGKQFLQVLGDGRQLFGQEFGSAEGQAVSLRLNGVQRLTLATTERGNADWEAGFGAARVLCTTPPGEYDPVD